MISILLLAAVNAIPLEIEEEEMALSEQSAIVEEDMAQDGELVFDDEEPVVELEEEF